MKRPSGPETERDVEPSPPAASVPERGSGERGRALEAAASGAAPTSDANHISIEVVETAPSTSRAAMLPRPVAGGARGPAGPRRRSGEGDTLLSVPAPAETAEVETEDRVRSIEQRLTELEARVGQLAAQLAAAAGTGRNAWAPWVIVLLLLLLLGHLLVRAGAR